MPVLNKTSLQHREEWNSAGIRLPDFDIDALEAETKANPRWVHIGPGNIFRGYVAALAQDVIRKGYMKGGITVLSTFDHQIMDKIYTPYDNLTLQVLMHADGTLEKTVIASIGESLRADPSAPGEWRRAKEIFAHPGLQMVSFTITEKGYHIKDIDGAFCADVQKDLADGALGGVPRNGMSIIAALLLARFQAGGAPVAMVSMDNFSQNGDKLKDSISLIVSKWVENGTAPSEFLDYIIDPERVSFPWSMIDKITPRPDAAVARALKKSGFESVETVITDKNTYIAPFVNAEAPQYLVVEHAFPNGRPPLEQAGVYFVDRRTVELVERMKVCTCLNPLHTAMAMFGCLLGYSSIANEMEDEAIAALVHQIGYVEGLPVAADPGILKPEDFLAEVIQKRLPNPYIPDTPQRVATDTSQKLSSRFGETIKLYCRRSDLNPAALKAIPLSIAAWCRYLLGLDDEERPIELSPDPMMEQLRGYLSLVRFGQPETVGESLRPILSSTRIFGLDLYETGLGETIEEYFKRMITGKHAVRQVLEQEVLDR